MRRVNVILLILFGLTEPLLAASSGNVTLTVTVQQLVAVEVTAPGGQSGNPGALLTYLFTVQNAGTGPDAFNLKASSSERFSVNLPGGTSTGLLNPGSSAQVTVELTIPAGEPAGTQDLLTLEATSQTDRKISDQASVTTIVNQVAGVSVSAPRDQRGKPGATLTYQFTVQNTGNGADSFQLAATSTRGWPINLPGGMLIGPLTADKGASSRQSVTVEVTIPLTEPVDTQDLLTLTATSQFNPSVSAQASVTSTVVRRGPP